MMDRPDGPKAVNVMNLPSAESVRERIKKREANILMGLDDNQSLVLEYHVATGMVVQIREVGFYADSDDALLLVGVDADTGEDCQIIAPPNAVQMVFRVVNIEDSRGKRKRTGFFVATKEESVES